MIVYGDPSTQESLQALLERLQESLSALRPGSLDDVRAALIQAGMLEQALEDAGAEEAISVRRLTDVIVDAFLRNAKIDRSPDFGPSALETLALAPNRTLTVKTPEGFAFYGLYPEAYAVAAQQWLADHPGAKVAVIGVRSIGTTLSAVVLAALRARRARAFRLTVRPTGHPFAREADLPPLEADWAIVVDEGPGLSGSSMAAVAEATVRAGIARERVVFFPGHGGEPGAQASPEVRAWWRDAPRVAVGTETLRWGGLTLEETLLRHTEGGVRTEELTGGRWRELVYRDPADWPGVAMPFERRKLRVVREDGSAALWKFVGLTIPGTILGFAASPWIEGEPLRREDATPELVTQIGRLLEAVAGPPLSPEGAQAARTRLEEMLRVNLEEARVPLTPPSLPQRGEGSASAGDYRLAPWEWRRLPNGEITKAGRIAPTLDHTVVGRQPLAWDVAGAMVEWGLDGPSELPAVSDLPFYRAAYAAFRMGQCRMFAGDEAEGERLRRDAAFYRAALDRALG